MGHTCQKTALQSQRPLSFQFISIVNVHLKFIEEGANPIIPKASNKKVCVVYTVNNMLTCKRLNKWWGIAVNI